MKYEEKVENWSTKKAKLIEKEMRINNQQSEITMSR